MKTQPYRDITHIGGGTAIKPVERMTKQQLYDKYIEVSHRLDTEINYCHELLIENQQVDDLKYEVKRLKLERRHRDFGFLIAGVLLGGLAFAIDILFK